MISGDGAERRPEMSSRLQTICRTGFPDQPSAGVLSPARNVRRTCGRGARAAASTSAVRSRRGSCRCSRSTRTGLRRRLPWRFALPRLSRRVPIRVGWRGNAPDQQQRPLIEILRQRMPETPVQRHEDRHEARGARPAAATRRATTGSLRTIANVERYPPGAAVPSVVQQLNECGNGCRPGPSFGRSSRRTSSPVARSQP